MSRTPVISLGAGVQSSTLLLMAAHGEFEVTPRLAIFADTGAEPKAVYDWLGRLRDDVRGRIEVVTVCEGSLTDAALGRSYNPIPTYKRTNGTVVAGRRQCTKEFKLYPIRHELRRRGLNHVEQWLGISLDEVERMKPSGLKWLENRWPLIERRMTRQACLGWLDDHGYQRPPRSACVYCPYRSDSDWRTLRESPEDWQAAVSFDEALRARDEFVHSSAVPLPMVDLSTPEDRGQGSFAGECEGMCGV